MGTWNDFCAFNPTGGLYGLDKRGFSPRVCPGKDGQQADCSIHYEHNWLQGSFASRAGGAKFWGVNVSNNSFVRPWPVEAVHQPGTSSRRRSKAWAIVA